MYLSLSSLTELTWSLFRAFSEFQKWLKASHHYYGRDRICALNKYSNICHHASTQTRLNRRHELEFERSFDLQWNWLEMISSFKRIRSYVSRSLVYCCRESRSIAKESSSDSLLRLNKIYWTRRARVVKETQRQLSLTQSEQSLSQNKDRESVFNTAACHLMISLTREVFEELDRDSQNFIREVKERHSQNDSETKARDKNAHCVCQH